MQRRSPFWWPVLISASSSFCCKIPIYATIHEYLGYVSTIKNRSVMLALLSLGCNTVSENIVQHRTVPWNVPTQVHWCIFLQRIFSSCIAFICWFCVELLCTSRETVWNGEKRARMNKVYVGSMESFEISAKSRTFWGYTFHTDCALIHG